jgi:hypothetical protein
MFEAFGRLMTLREHLAINQKQRFKIIEHKIPLNQQQN